MVTVLKVKNESDSNVGYRISEAFKDVHGFSIFDRMLVRNSECGEYEYLYLFINEYELNTFINIILTEDTTIFNKRDFTNDLIDIIVNNNLDEFKSKFELFFDFDDIIGDFYLKAITKDIVLDKMCFSGKDSLTKFDYKILNQ